MKTLIGILLFALCLNLYAPPISTGVEIKKDKLISVIFELHFIIKDKTISKIQKTIKKIESRNNYFICGLSGEYGAYQFMPKTWERLSLKYFNCILDITIPENQDKLAYEYINNLLNKGYNELQIASIWNSGSPKWENKIGVNKFGVSYNVPKYVDKFYKVFREVS